MALGIPVFDIFKLFSDSIAATFSVVTNNITTVSSNVTDLSTSTATNVGNLQNFTISTQTQGSRKSTWVAPYPVADVTYPDSMNLVFTTFGSTGSQTAGTAHTHPTLGTVSTSPSLVAVAQGISVGTYVTITDPTVMDTVAIYGGKTSGTLNNCYLEVFQENADTSLTRISSTDISASLLLADTYIETPLNAVQVVQPTERYLIRLRNASTVVGVADILGLTSTNLAPSIAFATSGSSLSNQTSYTAAEATSARTLGSTVAWGMLAAKGISPGGVSYSDDFNRATFGGLWLLISSWATQLALSSNRVAYSGSTNGDQNGLYIRPCTGDGNRIDFDVTNSALATTHARCGGYLHATQDLSQMVYLGVTDNAVNIYSGSSSSLTSRATISTTGNDGSWSLIYDVGTDTYTAYKNGASTGLAWASAGGTVTHSRRHRFGGVRISRASSVNAGNVDNWTLKDYG